MLRGFVLFGFMALSGFAQETRAYVDKGKTIQFQFTSFSPSLQITESNGELNQSTAVNCLRLVWSRLKAMDLQGAARLFVDPKSELEQRTKHRERVGEAAFREVSSKIGQDTRFTHQLILRNERALVGENGLLAMFRLQDGKFFMENVNSVKGNADAMDLNTVGNAVGDAKLRLP